MKKSLLLIGMMFFYATSFGQTYTFTNAGATGNTGPTQSQLNTAYTGTDLDGDVEGVNGIQYWEVPASGLYEIQALGGQGYGSFGGRGASITGEFFLNAGDTLKILVGQKAGDYLNFPSTTYDHQFGGGGGSFITYTDNTPLMVAGGGGGSHAASYITTSDGQTGTAGEAGANASTTGAGGTNGQGGLQASSADAGAGLLGDGDGTAGGEAFVNGGLGGIDEGTGGFGGGGGTSSYNNYRSGGGGGYSGGGGANNVGSCCPSAGGGGSFNSGNNPVNIAGVQTGDGQVIITALSTGAEDDAGVISIDQVTVSECPTSMPVTATIQNFGGNQITSVTVNWSVDGVLQTPVSNTSTLDTIGGTGSITANVTLGNYTFSSGSNTIIAWTTNPNGNVDTVGVNDSTTSVQTPIGPPQGLTVSNITSSGADVSWTSSGANSYNIIYGLKGFDPATGGQTSNSTTSPATLSLNAGTAYDVYLVGDCGSGAFSDTAGPESFSTLCVALTSAFTLPFTEDFESYTGPSLVQGDSVFICNPSYSWSFEEADASGELLLNTTVVTNPANSGVQSAIIAGGSGTNGEQNNIILTINLSAYDTTDAFDKVLEFYFQDFADEPDPEDRVSLRGDTSQPWVEIYDWSTLNSSNWEQVKVNLTAALKAANQNFSDSTQIRWSQNDNAILSGNDGFGIDDVSIEEVSCFEINNALVKNITLQSAQVNLSGEPAGTAFNAIWGPCGFFQASPASGIVSGTDSLTISGLSASTCYEVYLVKNCTGSSNGYSDTTGPFTFQTPCLINVPYTEDFEAGFSNGTIGSAGINCISTVRTTDPNWEVEDASGSNENSLNTGPFYDNTLFGTSGGVYVYLETSGGSQGEADTLTTGLIDISSLNTPFLSFAYHMYGADMGDLEVEVLDGNVWNSVVTVSGQQQTAGGDPWIEFKDTLNVIKDTVQLRFIGIKGSGLTSDMSLDDIKVSEAPSCLASTMLGLVTDSTTSSSALVNWSAGSGTRFEVVWGPPGFTVPAGALGSASVVDTFYTITGLSPQTQYDVYVRDSCGTSSFSSYSGPLVIQTPIAGPSPVTCIAGSPTLVLAEEFDAQGGWTGDIGTSTGEWNYNSGSTGSSNTGPLGAYSGSNYIYFEASASGPAAMVSPAIDLSQASGRVELAFWIHAYGSDIGYLDVGVSNSSNGPFTNVFNLNGQLQTSSNDPWQQVGINLDAYAGQVIYLEFEADRTTSFSGDISLDLLTVEACGNFCFGPDSLGVTSLSDTAATLSWTSSSGGIDNEIWFGPQGFYQGTQSTVGGFRTFTTADSLLVDTLTSLTCYEYLVRTVCSPGDTTLWAGPFSFCTKCPNIVPMTLPYFDGFESYSGPIGLSGTFFCGPSYSWAVDNPGSNGSVLFNYSALGGPAAPYNGSQSAGLQSLSSTDPIFLIFTGELSAYTNVPNLQMLLSFYFADHLDETGAEDKVWVRGGVSDPWIEILDWNAIDATTNWQKFEIRLDSVLAANSQSFSSSTQVRWGQVDNAALTGNDGFSVDDFMLQASTCPAPTNLAVSNTTTTTTSISWTSGGASNLQIEYGPRGFTPGSGQFASATTSPYTLTGLTPGTVYELIIRDSCGVGDVSFPVGPSLFKTNCASALSGNYTIGATGNFATFDSVATVLNNCGVSGPVTFTVQPGTYTDHLHLIGIPGLYTGVPGLSATNTITFNGGGNTLVWDGNGPQATILLDGSGHITFDNMTIINNAASEGWGVLLTGNSDSVTISNSTIIVDSTGAFASDVSPLVVSAEYDNDGLTGADVDGLTVSGCELIGGYYGLTAYGQSTTNRSTNYLIEDNIIRNFYISGMYLSDLDGVQLLGNTIRSNISVSDEDGMYLIDIWNYNIEENNIAVKDYGMYLLNGNEGTTTTTNSTIINNMVSSESDYAMYLNDCEQTDVWHNTTHGDPGLYLVSPSTMDVQNNIFTSDNDFAFETSVAVPSDVSIDYNLYYSTGTDAFDIGPTTYTDLAAWQTGDPGLNVNSVEGDPLFVALDDLHVFGGLADDAGNNTLGITVDIDGDPRPASGSTIVDIGADEYTAVAGDLALLFGDFVKGLCLSTNDSISIGVQNIVGSAVNFATDNLTINYDVSGPVNSTGSFTINSGTLPSLDTAIFYTGGIDLSVPGNYVLTAYLDSNAVNSLGLNDTLVPSVDIDVDSSFVVSPSVVTLTSATDSVELCAMSSFFGGGESFFFSEVSHYSGFGTGAGTLPAYVPDDYIEITGAPGSDLGGITLEVYDGIAGLEISYTFPPNTLIGPNGTAIITHGTGAGSQPANFMYDGRGTYTGLWSSGDDAGYVLKDGNTVIDAVTYDAFTFPASSGVTTADWTGQVTGTSGTAGIHLTGPDNNASTDWTVVSATVTQDAQVLNANVPLPNPQSAAGFTWTFNSNVIDTNACTKVSPGSPGTHVYYASYTNGCGSFTDSAIVIVPTCLPPSGITGGALSTSSVFLTWDTTGLGGATYEISYGSQGFTPGSGVVNTVASVDSAVVTGIPMNLCYEYYVRSICGPSDQSQWIGPISACPDETICTDSIEQYDVALIEGQSALFIPWQGAAGNGGTASVTTAQASSGSQSIRFSNATGNAADHDDIVAYFDTISNGRWEIAFDLYVPSSRNAYFNIQQNHDLIGTSNLYGGEIYFQGNGTAEIQHGATVAGTFNYTQGQWNRVSTIIDLAGDSIWFQLNGTSTGVGFDYSVSNGLPLQFNAVDFFTGKLATDNTSSEFYIDDFCVSPYSIPGVCSAPTGLSANSIACDSAVASWISTSGSNSSILEYGPVGFTPGTAAGTVVNFINSPYSITGLTPGTTYDFYVSDTCATDTSALAGPYAIVTPSGPLPVASFIANVNGFNVTFDASASTNASSYSWDFGDGNNGAGSNISHTYATGGTQTVVLTATNACGTDDTTIVLTDVDLLENGLQQSLTVYPNPAKDEVNISFDHANGEDVIIRVLDLSGKEIKTWTEQSVNDRFEQTINLGRLADGVYMLKVTSGDLNASKRLIKQ